MNQQSRCLLHKKWLSQIWTSMSTGACSTSACAAFHLEWSTSALGTRWDQGFQIPAHRRDGRGQIREQMGLETSPQRAKAGFCDLLRKHCKVKMPGERIFCQWFKPSLKWLLTSAGLEGFHPPLENTQCLEASFMYYQLDLKQMQFPILSKMNTVVETENQQSM